jgi:hypothetical protein
VFRHVVIWQGMFGYFKESYGVFDNHSRDRHGSIFDGAEWDELW